MQFIIREIASERAHVVLNVDETALASVRHSGRGMASVRPRADGRRSERPRDETDRGFVSTTYMALVCDCAELQPLLPQVILPKYTKRATPPARLQNQYSTMGFPFEFWHGSSGRVTSRIFRKWSTRLRSAVGSFNPEAWIILILDCATCHLDRASVRHLRRLGILVVIIPAKLTWLMQLLDVYCFGPLKRELRESEARTRLRDPRGQVAAGQWMSMATSVIRSQVINRDWAECFSR